MELDMGISISTTERNQIRKVQTLLVKATELQFYAELATNYGSVTRKDDSYPIHGKYSLCQENARYRLVFPL